LATGLWTRFTPLERTLTTATFSLQVWRMLVRMGCIARVYGLMFCLGAPLRALYANVLNAAATLLSVARYSTRKARGRPLRWLKTEHAYPSRSTLLAHKRRLGEILVASGHLTTAALHDGLTTCPEGTRLGMHLVRGGILSEDALYDALSFQQGLP